MYERRNKSMYECTKIELVTLIVICWLGGMATMLALGFK